MTCLYTEEQGWPTLYRSYVYRAVPILTPTDKVGSFFTGDKLPLEMTGSGLFFFCLLRSICTLAWTEHACVGVKRNSCWQNVCSADSYWRCIAIKRETFCASFCLGAITDCKITIHIFFTFCVKNVKCGIFIVYVFILYPQAKLVRQGFVPLVSPKKKQYNAPQRPVWLLTIQ